LNQTTNKNAAHAFVCACEDHNHPVQASAIMSNR